MKYLISLDWFQYCCINSNQVRFDFGDVFTGKFRDADNRCWKYRVGNPCEHHNIYQHSYTIYSMEGQPLVHLHYDPVSANIPKNYVAAKVDNRLLYSAYWSWHLHNILDALGLVPNNITRADLCCDFQQFENGDFPEDFIKKYVRDGYGKEYSCYIRKHSNKCFPVLTKMIHTNKQKTSYFVDADQAMHMRTKAEENGVKMNVQGIAEDEEIIKCESIWEYLRWGTRSSACSVYLYDKSREMRECKEKPYIYQQWQENGILELEDSNGKPKPVYRVEISLTSKAMDYKKYTYTDGIRTLNKDEIFRLRWDHFATQARLEDCFFAFAAEYFCFYQFEGQKYKKNMPVVQLFPQELLHEVKFKPVCISRSYDTGRMEKLAANTFEKVASTMLDLYPSDRMSLEICARLLRQIHAMKASVNPRSMAWGEYKVSEDIRINAQEVADWIEEQIKIAEESHYIQDIQKTQSDNYDKARQKAERLYAPNSQLTDNQSIGGGVKTDSLKSELFNRIYSDIRKRISDKFPILRTKTDTSPSKSNSVDGNSAPTPRTEFDQYGEPLDRECPF